MSVVYIYIYVSAPPPLSDHLQSNGARTTLPICGGRFCHVCTLPCHWPRIESTNDCAPLRFIRSYHLSLRIFSFNFLRSKYSKRERSNVSPCEHFFEKEEKEEEEKKDEERGRKKKNRTARDEQWRHVAIKASVWRRTSEGIKNYENSRSGNWQRISEAKRGW